MLKILNNALLINNAITGIFLQSSSYIICLEKTEINIFSTTNIQSYNYQHYRKNAKYHTIMQKILNNAFLISGAITGIFIVNVKLFYLLPDKK